MNNTFAEVRWTPGDVTSITNLSEEEAEKWLENNAKHIQDRLTELGWQVIKDLLSYDGIALEEP